MSHRTVHLTEDFEARNAVDEHETINSIIHLVILNSIEDYDVIVVRKFINQSSCRRDYHLETAIPLHCIEDSVLIEITFVNARKTLNKTEGASNIL